jgi:cytochrome P450
VIEESLANPDRQLQHADFAGGDLHGLLASLRHHAPVAWMASAEGWLVTSHELAVSVMSNPELFTVADPRFSTTHVIGPSMVSVDGLDHVRQRTPFADQLRRRDVQDWVSSVTAAAAEASIAALRRDGSGDMRTEFAGPVVAAVIAAMLGIEDLPPATLLAWCTTIDEQVEDFTVGAPPRAQATVALQSLRASIERALEQPHNESILQAVARGSVLDREEVLANAVFLALASINPEAAMLNALLHLLENPSQLELVREDPARWRGAIAESQRLEPATAFIDRYATADVTLRGCKISRGQLVRVSISGANRDPAVFVEPDRFDIARPNVRRQLTFATGPHMCIGIHLTRVEAKVALDHLIHSLPGLRLDAAHRVRPEGLIFRKPRALHVLWDA